FSFLFTFCRKKLERPFVTTIHGSARAFQREFLHSPLSCWNLGDFGNHIMKFPLNDFATKRCLINSDHAVICSYTALNELRSYGTLKTEKTTVIYNGVNFGEIDDVGTDQEYGEADFSIIYAGRLVWTKGITFLLKAFKILKREMRDVNLKIFGSGPLEREIKKIILQSGLRGAVHFQSHMRHKDLMVEIKKSTVAVLPSLYEGQSMFALEAMACKKPLVVFDAPYSREIVLHMKNGVISKTYDCQDLSEKIELLLSDKKLRRKIGQNAYNYVKKEHNWDIQADKYVNVYHEIATPLNASTQKISTIA
ncbi:MAG: glycosyltransferase family 4 protein, partial [Candidatus Hodarchaeota archaeon]